MKHYRGFTCWLDSQGVCRAIRFGVTVCARTWEQLRAVIDHHIADKEQYEASKR